ncbi:RNA polymerase sigma-70 factor [Proteiniphilum saccharofermentans]|jgi:RNA polymerase sigma-70 factor (ECF subfamily)|uniref:RNA polymerase sigma-70 factor n=1 Tax=Proteiniphilum saccharofermentans TaxID=1642647 RepID=A0A1R3T177_9BACT|nr:RNA polymerase sigma-70 factor [Proteiniphilum saccharofermentans]SCD18968.1 RNA polymerase sigma-70 factor [Proteiniphilum saccharofermentans]
MAESAVLENLFRRIAFQDDQEAFKELFFDFYPALCVFAQRYISSPEACEDIVQDTFFHLWKNRKKIEITSSFKNLLITSVKNNCTDYLRKQSVRQYYAEKQAVSATTDTPEVIYTIGELEQMLHTALKQLPENVRRAFELSRFENMTYNQIAEEMSVSPKTIEAYISKALSVLRAELKDYLPLVLLTCSIT